MVDKPLHEDKIIAIPLQADSERHRVERPFQGRIRERVLIDESRHVDDADWPQQQIRQYDGPAESAKPPREMKPIPGRVVALRSSPVLRKDVFVATAATNTYAPAGQKKVYSGSVQLIELIDRPVYRLEPTAAPTIDLRLHITSQQIANATRIGLGYLGISDPADRYADQDLIVFGGDLTLIVQPYRYPDTRPYQSAGVVGRRMPQTINITAHPGVGLERQGGAILIPGVDMRPVEMNYPDIRLDRTPDLDHHGAAPFTVRTYGSGVGSPLAVRTYRGQLLEENGELIGDGDEIPMVRPATIKAIAPDDAEVIVRIPWTLEIAVRFNGAWTVDPETQEPVWNATGGYTYTSKIVLAPHSVTA
ncbi:hypothetical protein PARHAE_03246 [Paracoccus haematequi]|uniref:Uncharacterized protein n=1 Tax=Paracoccus haematequi TaxID=2491866 RepID=A0A447IRB2_9RHOB|nr:hypothetical protein [Paracoccus haematequi]VDS10035.1 hypothetical protein PARHAE_03246 [Paracoccus haematequi]